MSDKKRFNKPGSLQPNIEDILQWNDRRQMHLIKATSEEKENFIQTAEAYLTGRMHGDVFVKTQLRWWHW